MDTIHILFNNDAPHQAYEDLAEAEADAKALQIKAKAEESRRHVGENFPAYWHVHSVPFTPKKTS